MKVNSTIFKGIEYIQLGQLPEEQREKILETINRSLIIKILIDGKIVGNCLQYKDYDVWYENVYVPAKPAIAQANGKQGKVITKEMAQERVEL
jgi:(2Fe-2S) ferredoxin